MCHHYSGVTVSIAVVGVALYEEYSSCEISELSSWLLPFPNKYYVLNTWCVTPCGELPNTLRHLPSVRDQRDLSRE